MKRILLVEDNEDNLFLFRTLLGLGNYELFEATTGIKGVAVANSEKPDLIIMDIQLPDINGLEVTRQIRSSLGHAPIIIAVTSYAMLGDCDMCIEAGCNGYIEKPINPEKFLQEIESYF